MKTSMFSIALQAYWLLTNYFGGEKDMMEKPVAKWSTFDVIGWLDELGPWATNSVAPIFQEQDIGMLFCYYLFLKLPSQFAAWFFWNFQINHIINMKSLIILIHWWSPFYLLTYLYGENEILCGPSPPFWSIFSRKNSLQNAVPKIHIWTSAKISKNSCVWWSDNQNKSTPNNIALLSHAALLLGNPFWLSKFELEWQFQENSFTMKHFYKIILVQYNETWWKWCRMIN